MPTQPTASLSIYGKAILTQPDAPPIFDEPWQATALALAEQLKLAGVFSPTEWADTLGQIRARQARENIDDTNAAYFEAVLEALEQLSETHAGLTAKERANRQAQWKRAYQNTPHGHPVLLSAG